MFINGQGKVSPIGKVPKGQDNLAWTNSIYRLELLKNSLLKNAMHRTQGWSEHHLTKCTPCAAQLSLHCASSFQVRLPASQLKHFKSLSHFLHRLVDGRKIRAVPLSIAKACQSQSLQAVTRHTHVLTGLLATCPAQDHFDNRHASAQILTPAFCARP